MMMLLVLSCLAVTYAVCPGLVILDNFLTCKREIREGKKNLLHRNAYHELKKNGIKFFFKSDGFAITWMFAPMVTPIALYFLADEVRRLPVFSNIFRKVKTTVLG